jgi:hypothetical protein
MNALPGISLLSGWGPRADEHREIIWNHHLANPVGLSGSQLSSIGGVNHEQPDGWI